MSDIKKAPIDLIPLRALVGAARVLEHGNTRKDRKPGDFIDRPLDGVFYASTMRHAMELQRLQGGVSTETLAARDTDSGLPVIDHIICNLLILRTMAIRDGVLPEDPGLESLAEIKPDGTLVWQNVGKTLKLTMPKGTWSSMSAELAPEVLDEPEPLPPVNFDPTVAVIVKNDKHDESGRTSCGIVDCRACTKAEELSEDAKTNKFELGAARTEGMRW